ncbi:MAG: hypothetical protein A2Z16_14905 [Chloroflexi bacterium RBG_16_54_18]|nr:MAG: hypothetical protein A2Z16_14905 [Chloroflexi bacterium RBG_16_54_18]
MEHLIGKTLNRYKIGSLLGEGGMGAVFKAYDLTLERNVAVKVLYPQFARQPNFQDRFLQEARSAARLDHPGIVQVHDFGQDHSFPFIVMEYIPGDNLEKMLRKLREQGKWIPLIEAAQLVRQLCLAIDYAHRQGVLHRDIKPSNIMLEPESTGDLPFRPVITDLGLAKLAEGGILTQEGGLLGTPAYMSPEQASGQSTDERSDVYSLGILLFELCTGQKPFPARTITEAIRYHVQTLAPAPRSLRSDLPAELERIILQALEKDPDRRFSSAGKFAEAIQQVLSNLASDSTTLNQDSASLLTQIHQSQAEYYEPARHDQVFLAASAATVLRSNGVAVSEGMLHTSQGQKHVVVYLENPQIFTEPGRSLVLPFILLNRSSAADRFQVTISGVPENWLNFPAQAIPMLPGAQQNLSILIHPPRIPESRAGRYPITIRVASQSAPGEMVDVRAVLTVNKFSAFSSELRPQLLSPGEIGQLHLRNQGNTPETFHILWQDAAGELEFIPPELQLNILEGQAAIAEFRAETRNNAWFGESHNHHFTTRITPASGQPHILEGELSGKAKIPVWILPALLLGCLLLAGILLVFSGFLVSGSSQSTRRTGDAQTELALVVQATQQAGTAMVIFLSNANQATINAVTATASWMTGDDDLDGLNNSTELGLQTLPDRADTDQDVVNDGDEVNRYHTDPLKSDSDGDGLKDGDEIIAGLDPNKSDTDGDGIIDPFDEVPLMTSTPTADAGATLAAALTQTASALQNASAATQTAQVVSATQTAAGAFASQTAESVAATSTAQSAALTAISNIPQSWTHPVDLLSNRVVYNLRLVSPGQIRVRLDWSGSQEDLALIINGPGQVNTYAREDGGTGLEVAYTVTPADFSSGDHWRVTIASFGSGEANGSAELTYPGGASSDPITAEFMINPTSGRSVSLIILKRSGTIGSHAEWTGLPAQLALILNGSGQTGYYARQDGGSPLSLAYNVTPADFGAGEIWIVSLASFLEADIHGNIAIDYP